MSFEVLKTDDTQHVVYGWGSVSVADGDVVTDLQGDQIDPAELETSVVEFMLNYRTSGIMHEGDAVGIVIASLVTTPDIVRAFGLAESLHVGWILGVKVMDESVWQKIVSGELKAFSIQGTAEREEVDGD